jgi:hypothetical protein
MLAGRASRGYAVRMITTSKRFRLFAGLAICGLAGFVPVTQAQDAAALPKAFVDGSGPGWQALGKADFVNVNCDDDTWTFNDDGSIHCTGKPVGVIRTSEPLTNFELVVEWQHLKPAGNSGVFVWGTKESLDNLVADSKKRLPDGIECQVLDHAFKTNYEKNNPDRKADWFSTNGDVFPTGTTKMTPFPPTSPNGQRSFPRKELAKGSGEWNHYYIRAINGEVRLWVNGEEVAGGKDCQPASGYLCLESEGSPIEFRNLRIRVLP